MVASVSEMRELSSRKPAKSFRASDERQIYAPKSLGSMVTKKVFEQELIAEACLSRKQFTRRLVF